MSIIKTENLCFSYRREEGGVTVLNDLNIEIEKGSFVAIIGHNGSGKSTFAKQLNAILLPSGGSVSVCGVDTRDEERIYELRKNAGMVFQNPDNQIVATMVEEDVAFGLENIGVSYEEMQIRVEEALKAVNMYKYRKRAPHLLSGGQKQRVAIAGILAMQPQCIILDEPTAMLDPAGRREVIDTIVNLNKEKGITVVLITHYMEEVTKADRVIVLNDGTVFMDSTPEKVFENPDKLTEIGLSVPQSVALSHRLMESGFNIKKGILSAEECAQEILNAAKELKK